MEWIVVKILLIFSKFELFFYITFFVSLLAHGAHKTIFSCRWTTCWNRLVTEQQNAKVNVAKTKPTFSSWFICQMKIRVPFSHLCCFDCFFFDLNRLRAVSWSAAFIGFVVLFLLSFVLLSHNCQTRVLNMSIFVLVFIPFPVKTNAKHENLKPLKSIAKWHWPKQFCNREHDWRRTKKKSNQKIDTTHVLR